MNQDTTIGLIYERAIFRVQITDYFVGSEGDVLYDWVEVSWDEDTSEYIIVVGGRSNSGGLSPALGGGSPLRVLNDNILVVGNFYWAVLKSYDQGIPQYETMAADAQDLGVHIHGTTFNLTEPTTNSGSYGGFDQTGVRELWFGSDPNGITHDDGLMCEYDSTGLTQLYQRAAGVDGHGTPNAGCINTTFQYIPGIKTFYGPTYFKSFQVFGDYFAIDTAHAAIEIRRDRIQGAGGPATGNDGIAWYNYAADWYNIQNIYGGFIDSRNPQGGRFGVYQGNTAYPGIDGTDGVGNVFTGGLNTHLGSGSTGLVIGTTPVSGSTVNGVLYSDGSGKLQNIAPSSPGQLFVSGSLGWQTVSGSGATITLSSAGVITISAIPNASLSNSSITLNSHSVSLGGSLSLTATDIGLGNVTNDTQTKAGVVPNTFPTSGQMLVGGGSSAYLPQTVSGSGAVITLSSAGVFTISAIANASLTNSSITLNTHSVSLGGSLNLTAADVGAATQAYVDNAIAALATKNDVQAATTTALAASTYNNGSSGVGATITLTVAAVLVLDGYTPVLNDRLLIKNQAAPAQNGIYSLTTVGVLGVTQAVLTRTTDFNQPADGINGALTYSLSGTVNGNTLWSCTTDATVVFGTTAINWFNFQGATYTADESSVHLTGTTFSIKSTWVGQTSITTLGTLTAGIWNATKIGAAYGGTGIDSSASTGVPSVSGGVWSVASVLALTLGGTGQASAHASFDALTVKGADLASSGTTDLSTATGLYVHITGTTTITALGTMAAGSVRILEFAGALTFTYNSTSLILPGAANITTAAGDMACMVSEGGGNWRCLVYEIASLAPGVSSSCTGNAATATALQTARNINGVAFDGTAAITITAQCPAGAGLAGMKNGLILSNDATTPTTVFDISAGSARDSTDAYTLTLSSAWTKTKAQWVAGTGNGGSDQSTTPSSTWYHVYLIAKADGSAVDVIYSTQYGSGPVMPSAYTLYRIIGSMWVDGAGHWWTFYQKGHYFMWNVPSADIFGVAPNATTRILRTLPGIPLGRKVLARLSVVTSGPSTLDDPGGCVIQDPDLSDNAASVSNFALYQFTGAATTNQLGAQVESWTNTSQQVASRLQICTVNTKLWIATNGWWDPFGTDGL